MTDLVPVSASALDAHVDQEGLVLAWCEQAAVQLRETHDLDEGRNILAAMSTLEHAVKARDLNADAVVAASAMRVTSERRVGQLIAAEREAGRMARKGGDSGRHLAPVPNVPPGHIDPEPPATLDDHGISRKQAAEYGRLADADDALFDEAVGAVAEKAKSTGTGVTRSAVLRKINPEREKGPDARWVDCDRWIERCRSLVADSEPVLAAMRFGAYPGHNRGLITPAVLAHVDAALGVLNEAKKALQQGAERGTQ